MIIIKMIKIKIKKNKFCLIPLKKYTNNVANYYKKLKNNLIKKIINYKNNLVSILTNLYKNSIKNY